MTATSDLNTLLGNLETVVHNTLTYFEGPGQTSKAQIGEWTPWEVLAHFLYWHEATARGMEQVAKGEKPFVVTIETDSMNAESVARHKGESFADLVRQGRQLQARLAAAARQIQDLDAVVLDRPEGGATARQRLERLARHWQNHTNEVQAKS
ncbi:MAG: DinB family protein [Chloroflexi bacterium]|nr:DinB family protein [Chloroflexota bacterium]